LTRKVHAVGLEAAGVNCNSGVPNIQILSAAVENHDADFSNVYNSSDYFLTLNSPTNRNSETELDIIKLLTEIRDEHRSKNRLN